MNALGYSILLVRVILEGSESVMVVVECEAEALMFPDEALVVAGYGSVSTVEADDC